MAFAEILDSSVLPESAAEKVYRTAITASPGYAPAHHKLGNLLHKRKDVDGAIEAYCAAIKADPAYTAAHNSLGYLLTNERKDVDGAEEAYCAAIKANLGTPLRTTTSASC